MGTGLRSPLALGAKRILKLSRMRMPPDMINPEESREGEGEDGEKFLLVH